MNFFSRYILIAFAIFIIAFFAMMQCSAPRKTEYNIPATASEEYKTLLTERLDKGKELYKIYCADCHGIFSKGRDSIPNFSKNQIDNYDALFVKKDPKSHAVARKLSQEQVDYILTFLRLRKQS